MMSIRTFNECRPESRSHDKIAQGARGYFVVRDAFQLPPEPIVPAIVLELTVPL
jgi:hypothetical protein